LSGFALLLVRKRQSHYLLIFSRLIRKPIIATKFRKYQRKRRGMMISRGVVISFWWTYHLLSNTVTTAAVADPAIVDRLIEWVENAEHGVWNHDKIEIRRPNVPGAEYLGVFAKADIEQNELLMQIPRERYIHIMDHALPMDVDDEEEHMVNYRTNICRLATALQKEMLAYEEQDPSSSSSSPYGPYLAYLQQQSKGQLPVRWSAAGKDRLRQILPELDREDVVDWIGLHYGFCTSPPPSSSSSDNNNSESSNNETTEPPAMAVDKDIIALTVQRCYDVALIPLWDMVNHDNGKANVDTSSWYDPHGIKVFASRPILAGEEILATYDLCRDCGDIEALDDGTTEIFRDFGFVEPYPQRWTWADHGVWFEVHQDEEQPEQLSIRWDDHHGGGGTSLSDRPDRHTFGPAQGPGLDLLRRELDRLRQWEDDNMDTVDGCNNNNNIHNNGEAMSIPAHECYFIQQYHNAIRTALPLAIAAAEQAAAAGIDRGDRSNSNNESQSNPTCPN
jgi:hypothetical protein